MTLTFDPDLWLESLTRALGAYCEAFLDDPDVAVEMSYPDTARWTKTTPLDKALVHFETDDIQSQILGFGNPGFDVRTDAGDGGTVLHTEVVRRHVNFDVGVWVSAEMGGDSKRMQLNRKLADLFGSVTLKEQLKEETEGIKILSFSGGTSVLDRIHDIPIWRTTGMTLIVEVFSHLTPATPDTQIEDFAQSGDLVIDDNGELSPVTTP